MRREPRPLVGAQGSSTFDVVCAGEALWDLSAPSGAFAAKSTLLRFRPGGGAVNAALELARKGLHVGLAAAVGDDSFGRALLAKIAAAGVDVGGIAFAPPRTGLVFVEGTGAARQVVSYRDDGEQPASVPAGWVSQVLLLSGLSPVVAHAAALCKAARSARRTGAIVVIDVNARRHLWAGRDPRAIRTVLREADVVRCSAEDLVALCVEPATLRSAMRPAAVLVATDGARAASATGPFGEIVQVPRVKAALRPAGAGDAFTAAICAELARAGDAYVDRPELWERAIQRGHAAASARIQRR